MEMDRKFFNIDWNVNFGTSIRAILREFSKLIVVSAMNLREQIEVCGDSLHFLQNVKEHATLSAGASVDHGVEVEATEDHVNRAADRGCCVSSCSGL